MFRVFRNIQFKVCMFHLKKRHVLDICKWWWWWWSHLKRRHILNIGGVVKRVVASWVLPAIAFIAVDFRPSCITFYDDLSSKWMRIKTHTCTPWPSWCSTARAQEPAPYENLRVSNIFIIHGYPMISRVLSQHCWHLQPRFQNFKFLNSSPLCATIILKNSRFQIHL